APAANFAPTLRSSRLCAPPMKPSATSRASSAPPPTPTFRSPPGSTPSPSAPAATAAALTRSRRGTNLLAPHSASPPPSPPRAARPHPRPSSPLSSLSPPPRKTTQNDPFFPPFLGAPPSAGARHCSRDAACPARLCPTTPPRTHPRRRLQKRSHLHQRPRTT